MRRPLVSMSSSSWPLLVVAEGARPCLARFLRDLQKNNQMRLTTARDTMPTIRPISRPEGENLVSLPPRLTGSPPPSSGEAPL